MSRSHTCVRRRDPGYDDPSIVLLTMASLEESTNAAAECSKIPLIAFATSSPCLFRPPK